MLPNSTTKGKVAKAQAHHNNNTHKKKKKIEFPLMSLTSLEIDVRRIWGKPIEKSPLFIDLPRLAGRIVIESSQLEKDSLPGQRLELRPEQIRNSIPLELKGTLREGLERLESFDKIVLIEDHQNSYDDIIVHKQRKGYTEMHRVIGTVAHLMETEEKAEEIIGALEAHSNVPHLDLVLMCEDLFRVIGAESKTAKIFRAIHQNVIFAGVYHLKTKVTPDIMTRDVSGPEGWRIYIIVHPQYVCVTHVRREQSLATSPADEKFWFEWKLIMIFDKEMNELCSVTLKIVDLGFPDDNMNPQKRHEIKTRLASGNLIVQ